ncbi:oxidoreductase, FAD-binding domain protein, partial [Bordetella bronchiseptica D993]|uniref:2Fe-2S iron-sulfur cluster-binding protein n=1 Tax=Bordetella bronchiseptica TaxID=518 RepID=UPI000461B242
MDTVPITLLFSDGAARRIDAPRGASIVQAAGDAGLGLLTDCSNGQCGTCAATLVSGAIELGDYDRAVLPDGDRADGAILACVSRITGPCVVELPYEVDEAQAQPLPPMAGTVVALEQIAQETMLLEVEVAEAVSFQPGQYVRIRPEGLDAWRSYSMACGSGERRLRFYVRLVEGGVFSTWLTQAARLGASVALSEPHGSFFLRSEARPRLFIAGGTGLAPFLSMLQAIAADPAQQEIPTTLLVGARSGAHLFALDQLAALRERWPALQVRLAAESEPRGECHTGYATDLLAGLGLDPATPGARRAALHAGPRPAAHGAAGVRNPPRPGARRHAAAVGALLAPARFAGAHRAGRRAG